MLEIRWNFRNADSWQVSLSYDRLGEADLAIACADSGLESLGHNLCESFRGCSQMFAKDYTLQFYIFFKRFVVLSCLSWRIYVIVAFSHMERVSDLCCEAHGAQTLWWLAMEASISLYSYQAVASKGKSPSTSNQPHKFIKASSGRCSCANLCHFDFTKDWLGATAIWLMRGHKFLTVHVKCLNFINPGGEGPSPDRRSLESQAEGIVTLILKETPQRVHS